MEREVVVRAAAAGDLDAILRMQQACPGAGAWSRESYLTLLAAPGGVMLVAGPAGNNPAGFIACRVIADELEILNLAVDPAQRRQGIGRGLVEHALARAQQCGARYCWLEVRASNQSARAFYRRLGFAERRRRPDYYRDPVEDAVVCARVL